MAHSGSNSHVGMGSTYSDDAQRNFKTSELRTETQEHGVNARGYLPKGQAGIMNKLRDEDIEDQVNERKKHDPTYAATMHGNEPSRGAKIDAEIAAEEAEILNKKKHKTDSLPGKKMEGNTLKSQEKQESDEEANEAWKSGGKTGKH